MDWGSGVGYPGSCKACFCISSIERILTNIAGKNKTLLLKKSGVVPALLAGFKGAISSRNNVYQLRHIP